jgi:hypothetical protein
MLMLWVCSWRQIPMCSWPADDRVIVAAIGIDPKLFHVTRDMMMQGWVQHSDARFYHRYMTKLVLNMLQGRKQYRERQDRKRLKDKGLRDSHDASRVTPHIIGSVLASVGDVDVIGSDVASVGSVGSQNSPPTHARKKKKTNGNHRLDTRLSESWTLPLDWAHWTESTLRWPPSQVHQTSLRFRDYFLGAPGSKGVKRNWFATWRNWCRTEQQRNR